MPVKTDTTTFYHVVRNCANDRLLRFYPTHLNIPWTLGKYSDKSLLFRVDKNQFVRGTNRNYKDKDKVSLR